MKAENIGKSRFFGQVEQMYGSVAFKKFWARWAVPPGHDPHQLRASPEKATYSGIVV